MCENNFIIFLSIRLTRYSKSGKGWQQNCSAWLRLKLNTKMGLNHSTTPPHPTTRNYLKGSRHRRWLSFAILASLRLRNKAHAAPPRKKKHLTLSLGMGGHWTLWFKPKAFPSWTFLTWVLFILRLLYFFSRKRVFLLFDFYYFGVRQFLVKKNFIFFYPPPLRGGY